MSTPLVSLCMPNLNKRRFLDARMQSLLDQTLTDWELIVCDSFSDDGSWEFLQKFRGDPRVHLHQVPREGLYAGWNQCLRRARGQFVHIATSDDTSDPRQIEILAGLLERTPDAAISLGAFDYIDEAGSVLPPRPHRARELYGEWLQQPHRRSGQTEFLLHCAFDTVWVTINALLFRRSVLDQTGLFPTGSGPMGDLAWSLRASLASDIVFHPGARAGWRQYADQATTHAWSSRTRWMLLRDLRRILADPASGIPPEWKAVAGWEDAICRYRLLTWRESLGLFRHAVSRRPLHAIAGALAALIRDPGYLASQVGSGLVGGPELSLEGPSAARDLMSRFSAAWPPTAL